MASFVFRGLNQRFSLLLSNRNSSIHDLTEVNLMNKSLKEVELKLER